MSLTDLAIQRAKTTGKNYTFSDGDGLSLFIIANGGKVAERLKALSEQTDIPQSRLLRPALQLLFEKYQQPA